MHFMRIFSQKKKKKWNSFLSVKTPPFLRNLLYVPTSFTVICIRFLTFQLRSPNLYALPINMRTMASQQTKFTPTASSPRQT